MHAIEVEPARLAQDVKDLADDPSNRHDRSNDDVLQDRPFDGVHEISLGGAVSPTTERNRQFLFVFTRDGVLGTVAYGGRCYIFDQKEQECTQCDGLVRGLSACISKAVGKQTHLVGYLDE